MSTTTPVVVKATDMFDTNSTANGSDVEWIEINKIEIPRPVGQAVHDAFVGYDNKKVCSTFLMTYDAIEIHANMNNTPYHVVVDVHCILNDVLQLAGKFGLYLEPSHRNGEYSVTECSFEDATGALINYLTISDAHKGACQTPPQKLRFDNQPLQYAEESTKEPSTATFSSFDTALHNIVHDNMWLAAAAAGTGVVVVGLFVGLVVITRRRRRRDSNPRRLGIEGSSAPSALDDENGRLNQENDPSSTTSTTSHVEASFDVTTQTKV
ncbi:hypothetical protein THRCLA_11209 [Thraustotheca clavata]|uniref:Uncharacterized protein n=1 Tax=Thraustotheca clavata TaxID=74557 RepID=A0A1V9Y8G4_9STRA|nr:hypothetical protein THRCLA_11209 [Thraustotheca clavata]